VRQRPIGRPRAFVWVPRLPGPWITIYRGRGWVVGVVWNIVPGCVHVSLGRWEIGVWVGVSSYWYQDYTMRPPHWMLEWTPSIWGLRGLWLEPDTRVGSRRVEVRVGPWAMTHTTRAPVGEARPVA
jgi:hypothetical protein